ncbi:hypothetical protein AK812_SmicGene28651 [Symbiodinium microadriaticum]|uniref:Uncharacterized protein n=1 Tax=Symbiodinium microadriaticum TaxID=2951 RepID=A0A1Q9D3T2_SYMMI|nr:hypothetical protein AK812_SmicGene28651 [Symbiodinium microadriaticum]
MSDQALAEAYLRQRQGATTTPYAAAQQLYFEQRRTAKRGPPTPGFSSTGLTTPLGSEPTAPAPEEASGSQATPPAQGFVQDDVALQLTAAQAGVFPQDTGALRTWLGGTVTTRATVLETIRHYHKAVIRPELYNLVTQVEQALIRVDDRVLRQQADLDWMCSENSSLKHSASTPPARLQTTEPTMWQYSWNAVTFGTQLQIDAAEKQLFVHSAQEAKGTGKGLRVGKGARHWTAPMVYSSETNPYPIDLEMVQVSQAQEMAVDTPDS